MVQAMAMNRHWLGLSFRVVGAWRAMSARCDNLGMAATGVLTIVPSAAFVVESVTVPFSECDWFNDSSDSGTSETVVNLTEREFSKSASILATLLVSSKPSTVFLSG